MRIGVPAELRNSEFRVAVTPAGVHELARAGHQVLIETGAGAGSSLPDEDFTAAGAVMLPSADDVWAAADLVLKVKEPAADEYGPLRPGQILFSHLHLAASWECTQELLAGRVTAVGYETVRRPRDRAARRSPRPSPCLAIRKKGCHCHFRAGLAHPVATEGTGKCRGCSTAIHSRNGC